MEYKVSVVIPTYNGEEFIDDTINCLKNQTIGFENIEIIIVDDKSEDSTREILKKYSQEYFNIKCFYPKTNSGTPSRGRNIGIEKAHAEYIMFLDQDDKYVNTMCEILYETIKKTDSNLVMCRHANIENNKYKDIQPKKLEDMDYIILDPKKERNIFTYPLIWSKIYKKDFLLEYDIKFPEGYFMEDVYFSVKSYLNTENLVFLKNFYGYEYNVRDNGEDKSESHNITKKLFLNCINAYYLIYDLLKEYNDKTLIAWLTKDRYIILIGWFSRINENYATKMELIKEFYKLIEYCDFNEKLGEIWADLIFINIKKRNFRIAIMLSKIINILFNSMLLRKFYRKLYNKPQ